MKALHRPDLFSWSVFDRSRNLDFNAYAWIRASGNVLIDPLPISDHDLEHLRSLGTTSWIVITNSDHVRDSDKLAQTLGATLAGPARERKTLGPRCEKWLSDGDEFVPGLVALELEGSKTPGELALLLEETTLITGDLVRGHALGRLNLLPDPKLSDKTLAVRSLQRLASLERVEAVLVGDGWPVGREGNARLRDLAAATAG